MALTRASLNGLARQSTDNEIDNMPKIETKSVIITQAVAVKGKHYTPSDKPVTLPAPDANFLIVRKKAVIATTPKAEKAAD